VGFDAVLAGALVVLGWRVLHDRDRFGAVIQFIALGLLVAVAWVRLRAPDVALAEAAVGSGLTGALLLAALGRRRVEGVSDAGGGGSAARARPLLGVLAAGLTGLVIWAALSLPEGAEGLTAPALAELPVSGVKHPVTAVLLNYRGYDTLLEVGVLLLAIVAVWSVRRADVAKADQAERPLLLSLLRVVSPVLVLVAGYLLWIGASAPGGAFQGGALLGGALVLGILAGRVRVAGRREAWWRWGLALGFLVFAAAGALAQVLTGALLRYPAGAGGAWILAIESAALISIGLTLGLLFLGGRPRSEAEAGGHGEGTR
jgi:multisubunit Na+/H+ antiporter MnhB subunit